MTTYQKTIFVTGGAGFIGSNFLNMMVSRYPEYFFVNIDCITSISSLKNVIIDSAPNYTFEKIDIREKAPLRKIFERYEPTHIIHFAAESHVDVSIERPHLFIETNVGGTDNLLSLAKEYAIKRFHQISTDEVYGALTDKDPAFTENSPLTPNNPYSASKASADLLVYSYFKTYGLPVVITRSSNNYGPRADTTKFIPKAITALLRGETIPVYGEGAQIRDWLFVEDHIEAIDLVFHTGTDGEVYNIGGHNEVRNIDLAKKLLILAEKDERSLSFVPDRLGHDFRYAIDTRKIEHLGWAPRTDFEDGLKKTFTYYRDRITSPETSQ